MAKIKAKRNHFRHGAKVPVELHLTTRLPGQHSGKPAFQACVKVGGRKSTRALWKCAFGKNPRTAIASALRKGARDVAGRSGAFASLRRRKRRRR